MYKKPSRGINIFFRGKKRYQWNLHEKKGHKGRNRWKCHVPGLFYLLGTLSLLYDTSWFLFFWFNFPSAGVDCSQLRTHKHAIGCAHRSPLLPLLMIVRIKYIIIEVAD